MSSEDNGHLQDSPPRDLNGMDITPVYIPSAQSQVSPEPDKPASAPGWLGPVALVGILVVAIAGLRSVTSSPTIVYQQPEMSDRPESAPESKQPIEAEGSIPPPIERTIVLRNAYFGSSQDAIAQQLNQMYAARVAYFWQRANAWTERTGKSRERYLLQKLLETRARHLKEAGGIEAFVGSPQHQAIVAPYLLDANAVLAALELHYAGEALSNDPQIETRASLREIGAFVDQALMAIGHPLEETADADSAN